MRTLKKAGHLMGSMLVRLISAWFLALLVTTMTAGGVWAQTASPYVGGSSSGLALRECERNICFSSKQARLDHAKNNSCYFLEDVCEGSSPGSDNKGAEGKDEGFWGNLWNTVSTGLQYGYQFGKGLMTGLKQQIGDILDLITSPVETAKGLIELGKAFYDDPSGTLALLGQLLGQEVIDTINRATRCGAYDLGKVIGENVSPVVMLKVATRLTKYGGNLSAAVKATKGELGCASFAAGTPIWLGPDDANARSTGSQRQFIERIQSGQQVYSRSDRSYIDAAQSVENTFTRVAPGYRKIRTEFETYRVTEEHPLWVQGKGWTPAKDVGLDDVLGARLGDVRVLGNEAVDEPLRVYNFSVAQTPNYFVGEQGLWAHNAKCDLTRTKDIMETKYGLLSPIQKGFFGELKTRELLEAKGYTAVTAVGKNDGAFEAWRGQTGIDAIYKDKNGNFVIVESKATGGVKPNDPCGTKGDLCVVSDGRQMSKDWLRTRIQALKVPPMTAADKQKLVDDFGKEPSPVQKILSRTDKDGITSFHQINNKGEKDVVVGNAWTP